MIEIDIPGYRKLRLKHIVLDYNGTIACDGDLIAGVKENLAALSDQLQVHILINFYAKFYAKEEE